MSLSLTAWMRSVLIGTGGKPACASSVIVGLSAAAVLAFATELAVAADLPSGQTAPIFTPTPTEYNWTGFYVGVNAGAGVDHVSFPYTLTEVPGGFIKSQTALTERGPLAGGQIGYNYQLNNVPLIGHAVIGVEADSDWANINGSVNVPTFLGPATMGTRIENFGSLRGRIGYNFDRLLLYVTGGLSYGTWKNYYSFAGGSGSQSTTYMPIRFGAYGAGAEYALDNHWSIKAEYMYDYVRVKFNNYYPTPDSRIGYMSRVSFHTARLGVNYKFDLFAPPAPVVAKY